MQQGFGNFDKPPTLMELNQWKLTAQNIQNAITINYQQKDINMRQQTQQQQDNQRQQQNGYMSIRQHENQRFHMTPTKKVKQDLSLTQQEGQILLQKWNSAHWGPFNEWCQAANAKYEIAISDQLGNNTNPVFRASLKVDLPVDISQGQILFAQAEAKNKKDAKKLVIEQMTIQLIQKEKIQFGLKNKNFLYDQDELEQQNPSNDVKNEVNRLCRQMRLKLRCKEFTEACSLLCIILAKKPPNWTEISHCWTYALHEKNVNHLKSILQMVQYKNLQAQPAQQKESLFQNSEQDQITKALFKYHYGDEQERFKTDNPYDITDYFNVMVNNPDICEETIVNEDDLDKQLIIEPLILNSQFVKQNHDQVALEIINPNQSQLNQSEPNHTLKVNKITENSWTNIEKNCQASINNMSSEQIQQQQLQQQLLQYQQTFQSIQPTQQIQKPYQDDPQISQQELIYNSQNLNQQKLQKTYMQYLSQQQAVIHTNNHEPIIDQFTAREIKDKNINYISYQILNELYESLLYTGDLNFSLKVAELLYSSIKLDDADFVNSQACSYFSNKKNMLTVELLETVYQCFNKTQFKQTELQTNLRGKLEKQGDKFSYLVMEFQPIESHDMLEFKMLRKGGSLDMREHHHLIADREFVILSSCNKVKNDSQLKKSELAQEINQLASQQTSHMIFKSMPDDGEYIEYAVIAQARNISQDFKMKLFTLPSFDEEKALLDNQRIWKISKLYNGSSMEKTNDSLLKFCTKINMSHQLMQILLTPPLCNQQFVQKYAETAISHVSQSNAQNNLNPSQNQALKIASTNLLTLIQGPPGTGKTTTAVEIVLEWLRQSNRPVLACAESNIAVDLLHSEFQKAGIRTIRIGPGNDEKNDFQQLNGYKNYAYHQMKGQIQNANSVKYGMIMKKLSLAQVICATCVGSSSDYLKDISFTRVIIDEATQATELSCLIPLIKEAQQVVLIGDHKQLPPTVLSVFAQSKGMTISLFERLIKQGVKPQMLTIQYRMHPSIALFPSHQFYHNMLENGISNEQRPIIQGFQWPNNLIRVAIINIKGIEQAASSSMQNTKEVEVVIEVLMSLLSYGQISIQDIGIITPYDAQKRRIRNEINYQARKYPTLFQLSYDKAIMINRNTILNDVDTVDGYQGMERDIIIFSAVRSNSSKQLGFLKDPRRMNVTLTRAKSGLIIVCDIDTLSNDPNWRDYIQWAKANKILINHYKTF